MRITYNKLIKRFSILFYISVYFNCIHANKIQHATMRIRNSFKNFKR